MNLTRYLLLVATPILATLPCTSRAADAKRPNIVFIFSDDHAYQAISAYNDPRKLIDTPNIDLDPQFRLPDTVWKKVGNYAKYGFAVFKLRKGNSVVHPMAFDFPTALDGRLFFPTVHIHDGEVHPRAKFDHALYAQPARVGVLDSDVWRESEDLAVRDVNVVGAKGLVEGDAHVYKRWMFGDLPNADLIVAAA